MGCNGKKNQPKKNMQSCGTRNVQNNSSGVIPVPRNMMCFLKQECLVVGVHQ